MNHRQNLEHFIDNGYLNNVQSSVQEVYRKYGLIGPSTTTEKPPVIWFPDLNEDCDTAEAGGSFGAFSFLTMVVSVVNLVSLLVSNVNNNINNNNNNNNLNNQNIQGSNENNNNNNANVLTQITFAGRRRRSLMNVTGLHDLNISTEITKLHPVEIYAINMAIDYMRVMYVGIQLQGSLGSDVYRVSSNCQIHLLCELWKTYGTRGDLAETLESIFRNAYMEFVLPKHGTDEPICNEGYQCPLSWNRTAISSLYEETYDILKIFLKEE